MIHLLEVNSETTPQSLTKLARRLAMTGGFEMSISSSLTSNELNELTVAFIPELQKFQPLTSRWQSCNANRLLNLVYSHPNADASLRQQLDRVLRPAAV